MRHYLFTLHQKSDRHKKRFALAISGGFTLLMLAIWLFVHYGGKPIVATEGVPQLAAAHEVGPLESFADSFSTSWSEIKKNFSNLLGTGTTNPKTLDQYGR